jgi:hypothetical protein
MCFGCSRGQVLGGAIENIKQMFQFFKTQHKSRLEDFILVPLTIAESSVGETMSTVKLMFQKT